MSSTGRVQEVRSESTAGMMDNGIGYNPKWLRHVKKKRLEQERAEKLKYRKEARARRRKTVSRESAINSEWQSAATPKEMAIERKVEAARARNEKLQDYIKRDMSGCDDIKEIISIVGARFGFLYEEIVSKSRCPELVVARHAAIRAVHERKKNMSAPAIGRHFNRDHSTVLYALGRLAKCKGAK